MVDLVQWLSAQLDHDEQIAHRVLRQVAAGRQVLVRHQPVHVMNNDGMRVAYVECSTCLERTGRTYDDDPIATGESWPCAELRGLASIYSDRPGYDPSWMERP